jgi:hypothetical protein
MAAALLGLRTVGAVGAYVVDDYAVGLRSEELDEPDRPRADGFGGSAGRVQPDAADPTAEAVPRY